MRVKVVLIVLGMLLYLPVGLLGADYVAGAMFYVTHKQLPDAVSLATWPDSWRIYGEDPIQRKRLQLSAGVGGFVWFGIPLLMGLSVRSRRTSLHGDARFALASEIQEAGLYGARGVIIGKVGRRYLVYGGQEFVLLAAPTRSG
ncbi:MAG: type IV secretory system conjugative DNA transfer family protein, partial [Nitrospirota bacterium]